MKKKNPLISVVMNCHNGEKFLHEAIYSLKNQIYKNWELIFWDNCSDDNSKNIIKSFKDKRIKYFLAKKFTNLHKARNLALKKAMGDYISFLDCDDLLVKDKLFLQVKKLKEKNFSLIYGNYYLRNDNTFLKKKKFFKGILPEGFITNKLLNNYVVALPTVLIKRQILNKSFFNEKYNIISDRDLLMRISLKEEFGCVQSPLAIYRIHKENFSGKNKLMEVKELQDWIVNFKKKYLVKFKLDKSAIFRFKERLKVLKKIYSTRGINQKFFVIKKLISNTNLFNFINLIKVLLPKNVKSKIFFYN